MTNDGLKFKKRNQVSYLFKNELIRLIKQAGYNELEEEDLRLFSLLGGGAKEGISSTKIKWVLKDNIIPRINFLHALATIAIKIRSRTNYYRKLKITNPLKHEFEHYLKLCDYSNTPGSIWPSDEKFRRDFSLIAEKYLSAIPNIFWDLNFSFEVIVAYFYKNIRYSEQSITMNTQTSLTFGLYNYVENSDYNQMESISIEGTYLPTPDVLRFRIDNNNEKLHFKSIEVVRAKNNARILIELINGHWVELTNCTYGEYNEYDKDFDLEIVNHYNSFSLDFPDKFCHQIPKGSEGDWKSILTMEKLYDKLATNPNYVEACKKLTFKQAQYFN